VNRGLGRPAKNLRWKKKGSPFGGWARGGPAWITSTKLPAPVFGGGNFVSGKQEKKRHGGANSAETPRVRFISEGGGDGAFGIGFRFQQRGNRAGDRFKGKKTAVSFSPGAGGVLDFLGPRLLPKKKPNLEKGSPGQFFKPPPNLPLDGMGFFFF